MQHFLFCYGIAVTFTVKIDAGIYTRVLGATLYVQYAPCTLVSASTHFTAAVFSPDPV